MTLRQTSSRIFSPLLLSTGLLFLHLPLSAQDPASADFFEKSVRPVLVENCQGCHNPKLKRAGLDLTTGEGFYKGADSGLLIDAEHPEKSRILEATSYLERVKMPPSGKLKDQDLVALNAWVKAGAVWPGVDPQLIADARSQSSDSGKKFTNRQQSFWSFQLRKTVTPPSVRNTSWIKNPIDQFVLAKLEEKGYSPAPPATKTALLRRATFDLTGLPPTQQEIADFLADHSPQAFEKVVNRLLASPRYGERWGRHWLDVARYADSTGADEDHRYPDAWRYRDYVIQAFNEDLPYNQFVMEQIAGDLLPAADGAEVNQRGIIATGFLAVGPRLIAEQDKKKMFYDFVDEQIATTSRAFLGLTIDCARCHDHKFDPILQKDYYSLAAIFASTKSFSRLEGTVSQMYRPPLVPKALFEKWEKAQQKITDKNREINMIHDQQASLRAERLEGNLARYMLATRTGANTEGLDPKIVQKWKDYFNINDVRPHLQRWENTSKDASLQEIARSYQQEFHNSYLAWRTAFEKWQKSVASAQANGLPGPDSPSFDVTTNRFFEDVFLKKDGPFALPASQRETTYPDEVRSQLKQLKAELAELKKASPPEPDFATGVGEDVPVKQNLFIRGDVHAEGEEVAKQFPVILAGFDQTPITQGSGRLELAKWLTDPRNQLVPRVMVNRIWQGHFSEGIVRTSSNFGLLGERPTHPELLDWMAQQFIDNNWSIKKMHKLVMLSNAYQMSSQITKEAFEKDPNNKLLSHFMRRRLDVEEIRDSMLALDMSIDLEMGGTLQKGTGTDGENSADRMSIDPATSKRRTVYIPLRRSNLPSLLNLFDFGDGTTTNEGRSRTNVAPQALFVMNSPFVNARASSLAEQSRQKELPAVIREAFIQVLNRPASEEEVQDLIEYVKGFKGDSAFMGRRSVYRILLASNEFIYVD